MNEIIRLSTLLGALLFSSSVYAGGIQVENAWSRATAPGQDIAMVDLSITSEKDAKLVGFSSSACKTVELHGMTHENGMMKMREVKSVVLPAGIRVNLGESGYHLMLVELKTPLKAGDSVPLVLSIKAANKAMVMVKVKAIVKPLGDAAPQPDEHMHHLHR